MKIFLDVGGTNIRATLFIGNKIIKKIVLKTEAWKGKQIVLENISNAISSLLTKKVNTIAIGFPGPLNPKTGIVYQPPNLPGWKNVPLKKFIQERFKIKTIIENDANCAALAEARARGVMDLIYLNLGTGIGGGIILNNKIYHGQEIGGELGHMVIKLDGRNCLCGNIGCFEEYASGRAVTRYSKELMGRALIPEKVLELAKTGNKKAVAVYARFGTYLGVGLANIVNIFNPKLIVIGGGLVNAWGFFIKQAKQEMRARAFKQASSKVKLEKAKIKDSAFIGAWYPGVIKK